MKGIRTFVGIFPPSEIRSAIADIQSTLRPGDPAVRWELQEKFHVTIKFLGDISSEQLHALKSLLHQALQPCRQFEIRLDTVGCFPDSRMPKIVWIGSARDENKEITKCFDAVERACTLAGFSKDDRSFHPHITIGRVKGRTSENLIKKIENTTFEPLQFLCTELLIMKSDLSPSGSAFSQLSSIPLTH
ncbi:MAG TPA: RNA 2',3'-cyclic phosphodiesterase [Bacteroidota bacterium]|nr:RNA 2',3'-cyclic phosphodiesterase [Bacteroidota bacterium]